MASKADLLATEGVVPESERSEVDAATRGFIFQQTMYRVKDPKRSLDFYTRVLGFRLIERLDFVDAKFSLYFLGHHAKEDIPEDKAQRVEWMFKQPATLELTHNHGSEDDPHWKAHSGNEEPKGYGHIGFQVPDVDAACDRFEKLGVEFQKRPQEGSMKGLAFVKDPDGYWIEILNAAHSAKSFAK